MTPWNEATWAALQRRPNGIPGTLLLAGPPGVGKRSFARVLAQGILCPDRGGTGEPCGACASCRLFASGSHPDFRLIEPAAEEANADAPEPAGPSPRASRAILVGQIRELGDFLAVTSHLAGAKVIVIQPADRLHPSAANALLKTLEEPRSGTVLILVSDRPQRLLATVRSRCFRVDFRVPEPQDALQWLAAKGIQDPEIALAQAGFAPLAVEELEQSGFWGRRRALTDLLAAPQTGAGDLVAKVSAEELPLLCGLLYRWCYDLLSLRLAGRVRYNPDYAKTLRRLADNVEVFRLQDLIKDLVAAARALGHPLNARLVIERLAIRYTRSIARQES
jgi:DNA polymerase-3 subunit delta'